MNDKIFDDILNFVKSQRWESPFKLTRKTRLESVLKITGDDAVEFIFHFGKSFNVNVSNFSMTKYFEPEGDIIFPSIIRFFTGIKKEKQFELTLGDLERAVILGRLDEEVINRESK